MNSWVSSTQGIGINARGQITGTADSLLFSWTDGIFTDLGNLGGLWGSARSINDFGDVCGYAQSSDRDQYGYPLVQAFVSNGGAPMETIAALGSGSSLAFGINNSRNVVGRYDGGGFLYDSSRNSVKVLPPLAGGARTLGYAINHQNFVVGESDNGSKYRATLWHYDSSVGLFRSPRDLGALEEGSSTAYAISEAGHVVGAAYFNATDTQGFIWKDGILWRMYERWGYRNSVARGVNSQGVAVGTLSNSGDFVHLHHAFVYRDGQLKDLSVQLPPGWAMYDANAINDLGQIVGVGASPNGAYRMVMAEPDLPPTAQDDSAKCAGNSSVTINVLVNDSDPEGDPLQITAYTQPSSGGVTLNGGLFTYTPNPWAGGTDTFKYTINDGWGGTSTATVSVLVTAADVTSQLSIARETPKVDRKTGRYTQTVTIKKSGSGSVPLPMSLVLDGLSNGVTVVGAAGVTVHTVPAESPYVDTSNGGDGLLSGKDTVKLTLTFISPTSTINYTPRALGGAGPR